MNANARFFSLVVVFVCVIGLMGIACLGSISWGDNSDQPHPVLSAQQNVSFTTQLNENLSKLDPQNCDAGCYAKEVIMTYVNYRTNTR